MLDLAKEPQETLDLYGIGVEPTNVTDAAACSRASWSRKACVSSVLFPAVARAS